MVTDSQPRHKDADSTLSLSQELDDCSAPMHSANIEILRHASNPFLDAATHVSTHERIEAFKVAKRLVDALGPLVGERQNL
jgi:hypothetical protein